MGKEVISKSKVGVKNTGRLKTGKVLDLIKTQLKLHIFGIPKEF